MVRCVITDAKFVRAALRRAAARPVFICVLVVCSLHISWRWSSKSKPSELSPKQDVLHNPTASELADVEKDLQSITCITQDIIKQHSNSNSEMLVSIFDLGYLEMVENFYLTSIKKLGIKNYLLISLDKEACQTLATFYPDISCLTCPLRSQITQEASTYSSKNFRTKMNFRALIIIKILQFHVRLLHSDSDMIFFKNPFEHIKCSPAECDFAYQIDIKEICNGFVYMNPTPATLRVYTKRVVIINREPSIRDQLAMNHAVNSSSADLKKMPLAKETYLSGQIYWNFNTGRQFREFASCDQCIVVHNNFIVTYSMKQYRLRESGLWSVDRGGYYSDISRKYIYLDDNDFKDRLQLTESEQMNEFISLLAISEILSRTIILPKFSCTKADGAVFPCSILHKLIKPFQKWKHLEKFEKQFPNYRENGFLLHPSVPNATLTSKSPVHCIKSRSVLKNPGKCDIIKEPENPADGATSEEILTWFKGSKHSILRFSQLHATMISFTKSKEQQLFRVKLWRSALDLPVKYQCSPLSCRLMYLRTLLLP